MSRELAAARAAVLGLGPIGATVARRRRARGDGMGMRRPPARAEAPYEAVVGLDGSTRPCVGALPQPLSVVL
jgi:hypothetical protein